MRGLKGTLPYDIKVGKNLLDDKIWTLFQIEVCPNVSPKYSIGGCNDCRGNDCRSLSPPMWKGVQILSSNGFRQLQQHMEMCPKLETQMTKHESRVGFGSSTYKNLTFKVFHTEVKEDKLLVC